MNIIDNFCEILVCNNLDKINKRFFKYNKLDDTEFQDKVIFLLLMKMIY